MTKKILVIYLLKDVLHCTLKGKDRFIKIKYIKEARGGRTNTTTKKMDNNIRDLTFKLRLKSKTYSNKGNFCLSRLNYKDEDETIYQWVISSV